MDKMKIREVIVVEGKDDTKRINMAVNADTLETRGSAISDETLEQIEELQEKRGVIVFTDPDFQVKNQKNYSRSSSGSETRVFKQARRSARP